MSISKLSPPIDPAVSGVARPPARPVSAAQNRPAQGTDQATHLTAQSLGSDRSVVSKPAQGAQSSARVPRGSIINIVV